MVFLYFELVQMQFRNWETMQDLDMRFFTITDGPVSH